jgi:hypothetical protein
MAYRLFVPNASVGDLCLLFDGAATTPKAVRSIDHPIPSSWLDRVCPTRQVRHGSSGCRSLRYRLDELEP